MKMYIFAIIPSVVSFGVCRYINEKSNFDGFHWSKYKKKNFFQEWEFDFNPNISHLTSPFVFQEELI